MFLEQHGGSRTGYLLRSPPALRRVVLLHRFFPTSTSGLNQYFGITLKGIADSRDPRLILFPLAEQIVPSKPPRRSMDSDSPA